MRLRAGDEGFKSLQCIGVFPARGCKELPVMVPRFPSTRVRTGHVGLYADRFAAAE